MFRRYLLSLRILIFSTQDWIYDGSVNSKRKEHVDGSHPLNAKPVAAATRGAELRALHVVVSSGDEARSISCPICKEPMKSGLLEDEKEWMWHNVFLEDIGSNNPAAFMVDISGSMSYKVSFGWTPMERSGESSRSSLQMAEKRTLPLWKSERTCLR